MSEQTEPATVAVFFYGLFMDEALLASKGVQPERSTIGYINGLGLRIGRRATLVPDDGNRAYGLLMAVPRKPLESLYSEESVADYVGKPVTVTLLDGRSESALCYLLPVSMLAGTNPEYAKSLLLLAEQLGLPGDYLRQIRAQAD